jgi:hypothetical protein
VAHRDGALEEVPRRGRREARLLVKKDATQIKDSIRAWARRTAAHAGVVDCAELLIQADGFVYAMSSSGEALAWWPLPYLGPDGEEALEAGELED